MSFQLDRLPAILAMRGGISKSKQYDDIKQQLWTEPIKIGPRLSAWPRHESEALISAQVAGKSPGEIRKLVQQLMYARNAAPNTVKPVQS